MSALLSLEDMRLAVLLARAFLTQDCLDPKSEFAFFSKADASRNFDDKLRAWLESSHLREEIAGMN
jgi:hypothetical protein